MGGLGSDELRVIMDDDPDSYTDPKRRVLRKHCNTFCKLPMRTSIRNCYGQRLRIQCDVMNALRSLCATKNI